MNNSGFSFVLDKEKNELILQDIDPNNTVKEHFLLSVLTEEELQDLVSQRISSIYHESVEK